MTRPLLLVLLACLLTACGAAVESSSADDPLSEVSDGLGASGPMESSEGLVLGQTTDESGQPHTLVLNAAPGVLDSALRTNELFAVVSGSSKFSVTGDAAVGGWRFSVDSSATGDAAPIIVLKTARGSMRDLAANPRLFALPGELTEDAVQASTRLSTLIDTVLARAALPHPDAIGYEELVEKVQDPNWAGVMVFNASVPAAPGEVLGQSTGALAGTPVSAYAIGFDAVNFLDAGPRTASSFFGTVDHNPAGSPSHLRAVFANSALTFFDVGGA